MRRRRRRRNGKRRGEQKILYPTKLPFKYQGEKFQLCHGKLDCCSQSFTPSLGYGTLKCISAEKVRFIPPLYWLWI